MKETIVDLCSVFGEGIEDAIFKAVSRFYERHQEELLDISPITKASEINDFIYSNLRSTFISHPDFVFEKRKNQRFIIYQGKYLIRIKKMDKNKQPSVNRTQNALKFHLQRDLDAYPDMLHLYLGYIANRTSGDADVVVFMCPNNEGRIAWSINITEQRIQKTFTFDTQSVAPMPTASRSGSRIRVHKKVTQSS